jgi:hypothetical protein
MLDSPSSTKLASAMAHELMMAHFVENVIGISVRVSVTNCASMQEDDILFSSGFSVKASAVPLMAYHLVH